MNGIGTGEVVKLVVDFLTEFSPVLLASVKSRNATARKGNEDVLGPMFPNESDLGLGAVCVLRHCELSALAELIKQLLERRGFRFCLARLVTGA